MNPEQERLKLIRDFCIALDRKAKKFQSPKKIAFRLLQEIKKNRRGTRSINQYLDDHADLMREIVARSQNGRITNIPPK